MVMSKRNDRYSCVLCLTGRQVTVTALCSLSFVERVWFASCYLQSHSEFQIFKKWSCPLLFSEQFSLRESVVQSKEHSLLGSQVKHDHSAWSPHWWVNTACEAFCLPWDFSRVKFCPDCKSPSDEAINWDGFPCVYDSKRHVRMLKILQSMSECSGLWKRQNNLAHE